MKALFGVVNGIIKNKIKLRHPSGNIVATCGSDKLIHLWTVIRD